jgi:hypothetical protein
MSSDGESNKANYRNNIENKYNKHQTELREFRLLYLGKFMKKLKLVPLDLTKSQLVNKKSIINALHLEKSSIIIKKSIPNIDDEMQKNL